MDDIRSYVKERYAKAIKNNTSCCGSGGCCCGTTGASDILSMTRGNYDGAVLEKTPKQMADQSFGCGNPFTEARIHPGETVLDLGSGAGLDLFLASEMTGPSGRVIGLDMTEEMLATAAENLKGIENVSLVKGYIEEMPVESGSVDVIISNCVINLSADKDRVLAEAFRVLKPGGRFAVSDVVTRGAIRPEIRASAMAWVGCVAGALDEDDYRHKLAAAGFSDSGVEPTRIYTAEDAREFLSANGLDTSVVSDEMDGKFLSAFIRAVKPAH